MKGILHTDGACLGNPGPMGLGIFLNANKEFTKSIPAGSGTNNIAEYLALIEGLKLAKTEGVTQLEAYLDSKLVVEQVLGNWRVKDEKLQPLCAHAQKLIREFEKWSITHVRREQNVKADSLSKAAAELSS